MMLRVVIGNCMVITSHAWWSVEAECAHMCSDGSRHARQDMCDGWH